MEDETERKKRNIFDEFSIIDRDPPAKTSRLSLDTNEIPEQWRKANQELTLKAFPKLHTKETDESRLERAAAFDIVWAAIETKIKACLERTDAEVFASLLDYARLHHPSEQFLASTPAHGLHKIPTGLVLAGGINSADHVRTFPNFAAHLRSQGCYVALLQAHNMDKSLGDGISAVMQQFSGETDTRKTKFDNLLEWYANTISQTTTGAAGAHVEDAIAGSSAAAEEGTRVAGRKRRRVATSYPGVLDTSQAIINNRTRPLVIIIESVEAVPSDILTDFVTVLSEGWRSLPVCLIMGVTTTVAALHASLAPVFIERTIAYTQFNLVSG